MFYLAGFKKSIALQPLSVQGHDGLNVAAGIGEITFETYLLIRPKRIVAIWSDDPVRSFDYRSALGDLIHPDQSCR